jgi:hypothetical protein
LPPLRLILQFLVILGLYVALSYYLWTRLLRRPAWPRPWSRIAAAVFLVLVVATPVVVAGARLGAPLGPLRLPVFVWPIYICQPRHGVRGGAAAPGGFGGDHAARAAGDTRPG